MKHRIFIVDDHPLMRQGYAFLLSRFPEFELCGEAGSAEEALNLIPDANPDLVIVDISMEGGNGLELVKHLYASQPELLTLIVSNHEEILYAKRALRAGARGYIMKKSVGPVIVEAIQRVLRGDIYLSSSLNKRQLMKYANSKEAWSETPLNLLADRELEVFELLGQGHTTEQMAEIMNVSSKTVATYLSRLKSKLGFENNREAMREAVLWVEHLVNRNIPE